MGGLSTQSREYAIEPDASNVSYFFSLLLSQASASEWTRTDSVQGDVLVDDVLEKVGGAVNRDADRVEVIGPNESPQRD